MTNLMPRKDKWAVCPGRGSFWYWARWAVCAVQLYSTVRPCWLCSALASPQLPSVAPSLLRTENGNFTFQSSLILSRAQLILSYNIHTTATRRVSFWNYLLLRVTCRCLTPSMKLSFIDLCLFSSVTGIGSSCFTSLQIIQKVLPPLLEPLQ